MSNLTLTGSLVEGPQSAGDDAFPSGVTTIPFELNAGDCPKQVGVSTGRKLVNLNSPNAFVVLLGTGGDLTVTQAATLYARVRSGAFQFRVTYNGFAPAAVLPSNGLFVHEADISVNAYVTKFEVQGTGLVEFYASGIQ
jgi:hypothetical protein